MFRKIMDSTRRTTVAEPGWQVGLVWVVFPLLGAALLFGVELISGWVAALEWAPAQGIFRLISSIPSPWDTVAALGAGVLGGLFISLLAAVERLRVEVADDHVELARDDHDHAYDRGAISGVFVEGKQLVLLGVDGGELARETSDLRASDLEEAFRAHGYPWLPGDPHAAEYRRWIEGVPGLPVGAEPLLKARSRALRDDKKDDAADLRAELARLGVVVRDEKKRQFWRTTGR
ncbi:YqeB family protein [Saccharothrix violaceirubra]|uniref:DUF308 domain-containing protein n=1 Tax=Saccharothrix violaceirubra TaxID=413306 RepID=A0A7W7WYG5_9PSEU|nr:hypothetical protein [Saccharothrix violaceirubra]MBB4967683.1 hypothetical protein [Saccharothrix violaceirubra]